MTRNDLTTAQHDPTPPIVDSVRHEPAMVLAWSVHTPAHVGAVAFVERDRSNTFGRAGTLEWIRHRPGTREAVDGVTDPVVSREQLVLQRGVGGRTHMERVGRLPVKVNGLSVDEADLTAGDVVEIGDRVVLVVDQRPRLIDGDRPTHPFGRADARGLVGEGPTAYELRTKLSFFAQRAAHVLVTGPSGTGKELAARALHTESQRSKGPWVSRNAATIPESLADAELFGNLGNYPNPGMAARPGLVGEADGGTLFLDEFGELPIEVQARLLRVLDAGEYTRLGEARARHSDLRLIAATNRPVESLKHDVLARFPLRMEMPPLSARKEDVPLLAVHLLRGIARTDTQVAQTFFPDGSIDAHPRLTTRLVAALVSHPYRTHVRELLSLLWTAIGEARGSELDLFSSYGDVTPNPVEGRDRSAAAPELTREQIQACLDRHGGSQELAWRELGLSSRHALARLVKKHGLKVRGRG